MDPNQSAVLIALITSATTIVIAIIGAFVNWRKSASIEKKVDAGNAVTDSVHTIANGRTEKLLNDLAAANKEIQRLSLLVPAPPKAEP